MASVTWTSINKPGSHHRGSILVMWTEVRSVAMLHLVFLYCIALINQKLKQSKTWIIMIIVFRFQNLLVIFAASCSNFHLMRSFSKQQIVGPPLLLIKIMYTYWFEKLIENDLLQQLNSLNVELAQEGTLSIPHLEAVDTTPDLSLKEVPDQQIYISFDFYPKDNPHYHKSKLYGFSEGNK